MYSASLSAVPSMEYYVAVLKLSHKYLSDDGVSFAVAHLTHHPDLSAELQMSLACRYGCYNWVEVAFNKLLVMPQEKLTYSVVTMIGEYPYYRLMQLREARNELQRNLAYWPGKFKSYIFCNAPHACEEKWLEIWWTIFAKGILHPDADKALSYKAALEALEGSHLVCADCKTRTIDPLHKDNPFIELEDARTDAIAEITRWMICLAAGTEFAEALR